MAPYTLLWAGQGDLDANAYEFHGQRRNQDVVLQVSSQLRGGSITLQKIQHFPVELVFHLEGETMRTTLHFNQLSIGYFAGYDLGGNGLDDSICSSHDNQGGGRDQR
jgi:hypothetical protein